MPPKARSVETTLAQMNALKGMGPAVIAGELLKYVASKSNLVIAKAAEIAREAGIQSLQPELQAAFWRLMEKPTETDKGCGAKQAIANALYEMGCDADRLFLAGIRHVQLEGAWGGPVDTAAELRGICALGLVRMAYRDVMTELADLLGDESEQARIMAARAIAYAGRPEGQLLLRLKIRTGDKSPTVTAECLIALANLARAKALPFIQGYLDALDPTVAEGAAMAIGEMRDPTALALLTERWNHDGFAESRMALALPIALSRLPQSIDFLLAALPDVAEPVAARILEALRIYRHDTAITQRIRTGVDSRSAPALTATFHKFFPA